MISNITSAAAADTTSSTASSPTSSIREVNSPFGELFIQNLDSSNPTTVGWDFGPNNVNLPPGMTSDSIDSTSAPAASSNAAATDSTSTAAAAQTSANTTAGISSSPVTIPGISTTDPNAVLTAQNVFGDSPWILSAGGTGPTGNFSLNPEYFATEQTADTVAQMVGGTVVAVNQMGSTPADPFSQNVDNEMIQLADGSMINAGLVAGFFTHGYSLSMVQTMIQNEVKNVQAETQGVTKA